MRHTLKYLVFAFVAMVGAVGMGTLATLPACTAASPSTQYGTTQDAFIVAVQSATTLKRQGKVSQDAWDNDVLPIIEAGNSALDQWAEAIARGERVPPYRELVVQAIAFLTALEARQQ